MPVAAARAAPSARESRAQLLIEVRIQGGMTYAELAAASHGAGPPPPALDSAVRQRGRREESANVQPGAMQQLRQGHLAGLR